MPKHLAIDANVVSGTVHFENSKTAPPAKTANVKSGALFSGFVIGFQTPQTLDLEWEASERS